MCKCKPTWEIFNVEIHTKYFVWFDSYADGSNCFRFEFSVAAIECFRNNKQYEQYIFTGNVPNNYDTKGWSDRFFPRDNDFILRWHDAPLHLNFNHFMRQMQQVFVSHRMKTVLCKTGGKLLFLGAQSVFGLCNTCGISKPVNLSLSSCPYKSWLVRIFFLFGKTQLKKSHDLDAWILRVNLIYAMWTTVTSSVLTRLRF